MFKLKMIQLFFKDFQSKTFIIQIEQNDYIWKLKEKVSNKLKIHTDRLSLRFVSKILKDNYQVKDYSLETGHNIYIIINHNCKKLY